LEKIGEDEKRCKKADKGKERCRKTRFDMPLTGCVFFEAL
jgi:hypothetical protein